MPIRILGSTKLVVTRTHSAVVKQQRYEAAHAPLCIARVKNAWFYTFSPRCVVLTWHTMEQRDKFATYKSRKDFGNNVHEKEVEVAIFGLWLSGVYTLCHSLKNSVVATSYFCE